MTMPELPPLIRCEPAYSIRACLHDDEGTLCTYESHEARERILLAYIASLEAINENNLAEAAARIAELGADAARLDSGRIMFTTRDVYGEPARVTFAGVDLRAAIDAAREAKP